MAKKPIKWTDLDNINLSQAVNRVRDAAADLAPYIERMKNMLGDPSLTVSSLDMDSAIVAQGFLAQLLLAMSAATQLQERRGERDH